MRLLKYVAWLPLVVFCFFYCLFRDWWLGLWKQLRPKVVATFGWGMFAALVLLLLTVAPGVGGAIVNLVFATAVIIGVIWFCLYRLPGGGKKKKK